MAKLAENCLKVQEMAGDGWKLLEIADMARNDGIWLEMA